MAFIAPKTDIGGFRAPESDIGPSKPTGNLTSVLPGKKNLLPDEQVETLGVKPSMSESTSRIMAFLRPFHETASLGISSKIIPAFEGEGKTYGARKEEYKNVSKALEEAFPVASTLGNVAGYVKGPGKKAFSPALSLVNKIEKKAGQVFAKPIATGLGFGASEGIKEGIKTESPKKGLTSAVETALATAIGVPVLKKASNLIGKGYKAAAYKMGGIGKGQGPSKEAFEAYVKDPEKVASAAGKQGPLAEKLADKVAGVSRTKLNESKTADAFIKRMGGVSTARVLESFNKLLAEKPMSPEDAATLKHLGTWKQYLDDALTTRQAFTIKGSNSSVPDLVSKTPVTKAETLNKFKKTVQGVIDDKYGSDKASEYFKKLKTLAYEARQALIDASKLSPKTEGYEQVMKDLSAKMQAFDNLNKLLGSDIGSKLTVALGKIEGITNKSIANKRFMVRLRDFDKQFGTNFLDEATYAKYAKELGASGRPNFGPYWRTGGLTLPVGSVGLPPILGALGANPISSLLLALPGAALSSPRLTATALRAGAKVGTSQPMLYKKLPSSAVDAVTKKEAIKKKLEGR